MDVSPKNNRNYSTPPTVNVLPCMYHGKKCWRVCWQSDMKQRLYYDVKRAWAVAKRLARFRGGKAHIPTTTKIIDGYLRLCRW